MRQNSSHQKLNAEKNHSKEVFNKDSCIAMQTSKNASNWW